MNTHGIGVVNGHRHAPRREHVARIKPRQHPLYGRILREELAGIGDESVFGEAERRKRDVELVDDLLRHVLGHQCVQSDGEIDVVAAEIRGRERDVQHRSARGGVLALAKLAACRRAGVRETQMEIVVLVERGQVVVIEDEGEQVEIGVQLVIVAHPLVPAVEERDAPAHVRVAYLGGDIAHFRAVGHLFHKLRVELVRSLETRLHSRHRTRDDQPFRGDVRAVLGEGDGHLAAEIGQHGEKFRGVVYAERRKQRRRDFAAEDVEHRGEISRALGLIVLVGDEAQDAAVPAHAHAAEECLADVEDDVRKRLARRTRGRAVIDRAEQVVDVQILDLHPRVRKSETGRDVDPRHPGVAHQREEQTLFRSALRRLRRRGRVRHLDDEAGVLPRRYVIVETDEQRITALLRLRRGCQSRAELAAREHDVVRDAFRRLRKIMLPGDR